MLRLFCIVFAVSTLNAQSAPSTQDQILDQLKQLTKLFQEFVDLAKAPESPARPPTPVSLKVDIKDSPVIGDDKAPVTIVEFTDFQCPFCKKFHEETFPTIREKYISTGKVRLVSRDLPLPPEMHPNALQAAEAGRCAGEQHQFWEMRNWMQSNPDKLDLDSLRNHAIDLKLDLNQYRECMATAKYRKAVEADRDFATKNSLNGTPAFVIGKSSSDFEGETLVGALPLANFEAKIDELLK